MNRVSRKITRCECGNYTGGLIGGTREQSLLLKSGERLFFCALCGRSYLRDEQAGASRTIGNDESEEIFRHPKFKKKMELVEVWHCNRGHFG